MDGVTVLIGELAERTGVSRRSLRHYEQNGLLRSRRTEKGWREYDESAVGRVRHIAELIAAGLTVEDVRELAPCLDLHDLEACGDPGAALETYRARLAVLEERMEALRRHRDELARRVEALDRAAAGGRA